MSERRSVRSGQDACGYIANSTYAPRLSEVSRRVRAGCRVRAGMGRGGCRASGQPHHARVHRHGQPGRRGQPRHVHSAGGRPGRGPVRCGFPAAQRRRGDYEPLLRKNHAVGGVFRLPHDYGLAGDRCARRHRRRRGIDSRPLARDSLGGGREGRQGRLL